MMTIYVKVLPMKQPINLAPHQVDQAKAPRSLTAWNQYAETRLGLVMNVICTLPELKKLALGGQVEVRLVNEAQMLKLNTQYRGKAYATDVLSFPATPIFRNLGILGELVICLPILKSQALQVGNSPVQELDVLLVHGVLHLLGFDHELGPQDEKKMAQCESKVLRTLHTLHSLQADAGPNAFLGLIDRSGSGI
jgi:probable rRNA maturation factor